MWTRACPPGPARSTMALAICWDVVVAKSLYSEASTVGGLPPTWRAASTKRRPRARDTSTFVAFGPLFHAIRGRRWVYTAHAVQVTEGSAAANVFQTPEGLVLCVCLATPGDKLTVSVRGVVVEGLRLVAPGGGDGTAVKATVGARGGSVSLQFTMGSHGAVVVVLKESG